jgi:hypothetical protein
MNKDQPVVIDAEYWVVAEGTKEDPYADERAEAARVATTDELSDRSDGEVLTLFERIINRLENA